MKSTNISDDDSEGRRADHQRAELTPQQPRPD